MDAKRFVGKTIECLELVLERPRLRQTVLLALNSAENPTPETLAVADLRRADSKVPSHLSVDCQTKARNPERLV